MDSECENIEIDWFENINIKLSYDFVSQLKYFPWPLFQIWINPARLYIFNCYPLGQFDEAPLASAEALEFIVV